VECSGNVTRAHSKKQIVVLANNSVTTVTMMFKASFKYMYS